MAGLPKALLWQRTDGAGTEVAVLADKSGLHARGTMLSATPVPFACRYELYTDDSWVTARFEVTVEGAGFLRTVRLERAAGRWRVTASEQGNLDTTLRAAGRPAASLPGAEDPGRLRDALDVDLAYSPLTNTLPVRRLNLLGAPAGTQHRIDVAWVLLPSLEVVDSQQTYRVSGPGTVRYASGTFATEIGIDEDGFVLDYPGLAKRA